MLIKDNMTVYLATKTTQVMYGQSDISYTDLRPVFANVQYMSNEEQQKTYGVVSDMVLVVRTETTPRAAVGDGLYVQQPTPLSDGNYPVPEFTVDSVKMGRIGGIGLKNPTTLIVRKRND